MKHKKLCAMLVATSLLTVQGCSIYKLDKSVRADPAAVIKARVEIDRIARFQEIAYETSTFSHAFCARQAHRGAFSLFSLAASIKAKPAPHLLAPYYEAGGFDENWRVLWARGDTGLKPGERVVKINGTAINRNDWGDSPHGGYFNALHFAGEGPVELEMEEGRIVTVQTTPACKTLLWQIPPVEDSDYSELAPILWVAVMPANAIKQAQNVDELRYISAVGIYLTASAQNRVRMFANIGAAVAAGGLFLVAPLAVIILNAPLATGARAASTSGMLEESALFATSIVAKMGGDPAAGLNLIARLEEKKLGATRIMLDENAKAKVRILIAELNKVDPDAADIALVKERYKVEEYVSH